MIPTHQIMRMPLFLLVIVIAFTRISRAQFETGRSFLAPSEPVSIAVGDFNHDGKLDLAVASIYSSTGGDNTAVQVLLGNGDGTFRAAVSYPVGTRPNSVAVADFNNDGDLDLVVSNAQSDSVSVLLGNGDGTFQAAVTFATRQDPILVTVGDFNGDGKVDIATLNLSDNTGRCDCVAIFLGNGDGTFQEPPIITTPSLPGFGLGIGRFTTGKNLDLAVAEQFGATDQVEILLGNGDGTFQPGAIYPVGAGPNAIAVADLNGDHNLDLAVAESEEDAIGVLLGNGDGTFQSQVLYGAYAPLWVTAADLNGDNKQDLVVADIAANSLTNTGVSVLNGNGDGTFQRSVYYRGGNANRFVAVGDFNGDRKPDIVYAASGSTYVTVLLNTGVVTFKPTTPLNFKKQKTGTTSTPQTVTLTNTGKTALTISSMKATGQFGVTSTCGTSVAAGANCTMSVTFSPKTPGAKSGTVSINDSASSKPQVIELSGTGT